MLPSFFCRPLVFFFLFFSSELIVLFFLLRCVAYTIQFIAKHIARADEDAQTWPMSLGAEGSNAGKEMW